MEKDLKGKMKGSKNTLNCLRKSGNATELRKIHVLSDREIKGCMKLNEMKHFIYLEVDTNENETFYHSVQALE